MRLRGLDSGQRKDRSQTGSKAEQRYESKGLYEKSDQEEVYKTSNRGIIISEYKEKTDLFSVSFSTSRCFSAWLHSNILSSALGLEFMGQIKLLSLDV